MPPAHRALYEPAKGRHTHQCPNCDCVWEHGAPGPGLKKPAHTCPVCGREEYYTHVGRDVPTHHDHHLRERDYENGSRDKGDESRFCEGPD